MSEHDFLTHQDWTPIWTPPIPAAGQAGTTDVNEMHRAIGRAVAAWGELEDYLAGLYYGFFPAGGSVAAVRSFGCAEGFYIKRKMIRAVADVFFVMEEIPSGIHFDGGKERLFSEVLKEYLARLDKLAQIRNNIIHGKLYLNDGYIVIGPLQHDTKYKLETCDAFFYSSVDVEEFAKVFDFIPREIRLLRDHLYSVHHSSGDTFHQGTTQG